MRNPLDLYFTPLNYDIITINLKNKKFIIFLRIIPKIIKLSIPIFK